MPGLEINLNQNPLESALDNPVDRDDIGEWDGPANELDYDMVWNDEYQGDQDRDRRTEGVQVPAADGQGADGDQDDAAADGVQAESLSNGSNNNKRRFYSDDLKIAIYLELLAKTDPPILRRGVSKYPLTKSMTSVTKEVSRDFLVNKVLPAIKAKWHAEEKGLPIHIQQDNAKTHIDVNDPALVQAAQADGWDIRLTCQPPNSTDLGSRFFSAIQTLFEKGTPNNMNDIVAKLVRRIKTTLCKGLTVFFNPVGLHDGDHEAQWRPALQHPSHEEENSRAARTSSNYSELPFATSQSSHAIRR
nr:uncharacterized protein LOC117843164 [Setaria viridis]